jgi:AAA+ ATPase superfamily predicted ATPase
MELVGRENERKIFKHHEQANQSKLIALYGRRRIGKTYLVREHFKDVLRFEIAGLYKGSMHDQLKHFANTLAKAGYLEALISPPESWMAAFEMLSVFIERQNDKRKKVLFIDELPWFDTPRSKFVMAFENFWNSFCSKRKDILLIICGSSASWMLLNIVRNKGALHNRVSQHINLSAFNLYETEKFLQKKGVKWSKYDIT